MRPQNEALFTTTLGQQSPWHVAKVELNTSKWRIDFEVEHPGKCAACPACGVEHQLSHDRVRRSWRHLDFFQFEAWLHAEIPRVQCTGCGKTTQLPVPWAREGSGFTLLFEALGLSLCRELPVRRAANQMRVAAKRLWRRVRYYVEVARAKDDMSGVRHVGNAAMDEVRREEMRTSAAAVREAVGTDSKTTLRQLLWGMRKDAASWTRAQFEAMHWLQRSTLKSARAWRLKQNLRLVYREVRDSNSEEIARAALAKRMNWARRSRLEPFKRPAATLKEHFGGVVRGMLDGRSNAYVEAMNGLLQQARTAARGFRAPENFIAIAYLRMSTLEHLPKKPLVLAIARDYERYCHVC